MKQRARWPCRRREEVEVVTVACRDETLYRCCESLEYRIFAESGYVEETPDGRIDALDRYPHHVFLAALTGDPPLAPRERRLSGVMRIITAPHTREMGPGLFPTLDHATELRIDPETLARIMRMDPRQFIDVATMAIPQENRDARTSPALITELMKYVWGRPPLRYALAAIDTVFYGKLKARDLPFADLGPSVPYWGSPSTATIGDSYRVLRGAAKLVMAYYRVRGWGRVLR
ncbi:MAG: hypothetical protein ACYC7J_16530 [Syntrophales bacterium]